MKRGVLFFVHQGQKRRKKGKKFYEYDKLNIIGLLNFSMLSDGKINYLLIAENLASKVQEQL